MHVLGGEALFAQWAQNLERVTGLRIDSAEGATWAHGNGSNGSNGSNAEGATCAHGAPVRVEPTV